MKFDEFFCCKTSKRIVSFFANYVHMCVRACIDMLRFECALKICFSTMALYQASIPEMVFDFFDNALRWARDHLRAVFVGVFSFFLLKCNYSISYSFLPACLLHVCPHLTNSQPPLVYPVLFKLHCASECAGGFYKKKKKKKVASILLAFSDLTSLGRCLTIGLSLGTTHAGGT